ncbi:extensin-3-like isoform X2 [Andrographis paniculata]|uniref:extensin-3-like isoform X2 n=1 Tax=Andrographis paniculata TaxID=175694 RepID=UPI0021E8E087|nr:extensin-3-like isoform X2 [Andrographis paniculata]
MENPRVTEIRVRLDCNGCVQKIKKSLHGVAGISDLYIDLPQQKVTVVGWADPSDIVKAIKKTRKTAVICLHTEPSDEATQSKLEPEPESETEPKPEPEPESADEHQQNNTQVPSQENEQNHEAPSQADDTAVPEPNDETSQAKPRKSLEQIHVVYHHPPDYAYDQYFHRGNTAQRNSPQTRVEPPQPPRPIQVTHSYNAYKPSPYVTEYAYPHRPPPLPPPSPPPPYSHYYNPSEYQNHTYYSSAGMPLQPPQPIHYYSRQEIRGEPSYTPTEYAYPQSPRGYSHYNMVENYSPPLYYSGNNGGGGGGNITSMFSEENPNACRIV